MKVDHGALLASSALSACPLRTPHAPHAAARHRPLPPALPPTPAPRSYETLRLHTKRLAAAGPGACDLLICDEAHRLKNNETLTNRALSAIDCPRRVLLSGTPMQNHLDEVKGGRWVAGWSGGESGSRCVDGGG